MKLSVKGDYAARAVLGLARHYHTAGAVKAEDLAREQSIPENYLVQILLGLKSKGIVRSLRGKEGGYLLARPPAQITLGDVLRSVYGRLIDTPALNNGLSPVELRDAWRRVQRAVDEAVDTITFQELIDAGAEKEKMYYI